MDKLYYDLDLLKSLREVTLLYKLSYFYKSNWRVLHIDGFEGPLHPLPVAQGKQINFFSYAELQCQGK